MSVRVRYAPSPTGLQHIGGVRSALFNYFVARSSGGKFILRIEDTDRNRTTPEAVEDLYETLRWLEITWDEGPDVGGPCGPYVQSERNDIYREYVERLIESGHAYYCFCTEERVEEVRVRQKAEKRKIIGYDRHCRNLDPGETAELLASDAPRVTRFKVPLDGETSFTDLLLGRVSRKNEDINPDPVIIKSDGFPTYHFANVVDDHLMEISHIMRAQEWLPSGPLHVLLYDAFGWEPPIYCHLPMVMGSDGQKLSKRHGSTSVREFRDAGYMPEALVNYITLLGWSYDDSREFFTKADLEELFTLDKLNKAPAVFDYKKLDWFNGSYIRQLDDAGLRARVIPYLVKDGVVGDPPSAEESRIIDGAIPLVKERLKTLSEISEMTRFLFREIGGYRMEELIPKKLDAAKTLESLTKARSILQDFLGRSDEENEDLLRAAASELGVNLGAMLMPVRVAVTGTKVSPPLFPSMRLLGLEKSLARIDDVRILLEKEG